MDSISLFIGDDLRATKKAAFSITGQRLTSENQRIK